MSRLLAATLSALVISCGIAPSPNSPTTPQPVMGNEAPVATMLAVSTPEDTPLSARVEGTDAEAAALLFTVVDPPLHGTLTLAADGTFTYVPSANYFGDDTFTFKASDGSLDSAAAQVTITVQPINDPPTIAINGPLIVGMNASLTLTLAQFVITDVDNTDGFSLVVGNGDNYSVDGTTLTPAAGFLGTLTVPVQVSDGAALSAVLLVTVSVQNMPPQITAQKTVPTIDEDTSLQITLADLVYSDPDSDLSTVSLTLLPGAFYSVAADGKTVIPAPNFFGNLVVQVALSDDHSQGAPFGFAISVTSINDPPTITSNGRLSTPLATPITLTLSDLTISDVDGDSVFTLAVGAGSHYTVTPGTTTVVPAPGYVGAILVPVSVSDPSNAMSNIVDIYVSVANTAPAITAQLTIPTILEDTELKIVPAMVMIVDPDPAQTLTVAIVADPAHYHIKSGTTDTLQPLLNDNGPLLVTVVANDGFENSIPFTFEVDITPVNDKPVAQNKTFTTSGNTRAPGGTGLTDGVSDPDAGNTFTAVAASGTASAGGTFSVHADGTFTYTPPVGYLGADVFTYRVNDGTVDSDPATVTVTVQAPMTWYVDSANVGPSDGRSHQPFTTVAAAITASAPGHHIQIANSGAPYTTTTPFALKASQTVIGTGMPILRNTAGATLTLASGDALTGIIVEGTAGIAASNITGASMSAVTVRNTATFGIHLQNASGALGFSNVSVTTAGDALAIDNVSSMGNVTLANATLVANGGRALFANHVTALSNAGGSDTTTVTSSGGAAVDITDTQLDLTLVSAASTGGTSGLVLDNGRGTFAVTDGVTITQPTGDALVIKNAGAAIAVNLGATALTISAGHDGVVLTNNHPASTIALTLSPLSTPNGRGIAALNSGTLVIGGAPNITATSGAAIDLAGVSGPFVFGTLTSTGSNADGVHLGNITGAFTAGAITVTNASGAGFRVHDSNSAITVASLTIAGANEGLRASASAGSLTVGPDTGNGGTLSGITQDAVHLSNVTNIALRGLTLSNSGVRVDDFSTVDGFVFKNGSVTADHPFWFGSGVPTAGQTPSAQILGTAQIASTAIHTGTGDAIFVESAASAGTLRIDQSSVIDISDLSGGLVARLDTTAASGALAIVLDTMTVRRAPLATTASGTGINIASQGAHPGTLAVTVTNCTFTQPASSGDDALLITAAGAGTATIAIAGNMIDGWNRAITAVASGIGTLLSGTIHDNTIGVTTRPDSDNVTVMVDPSPSITASQDTQAIVTIANNTLRSHAGDGIVAWARSGKDATHQKLQVTVTGNTVVAPTGNADAVHLRASSTTGLCADVHTNTTTFLGAGFADYRLNRSGAATFALVGASGTPPGDQIRNTNEASDVVLADGGINVVTTCP